MGGAQRCLDLAVAHAKSRVQFGRPIGSFQAIQHKCADMMLRVESARSAAYYAACVAAESGAELARVASLAKAYCSDAYFQCAADSLQVHGGVGFTWEYDVQLHLKRAKWAESFLGDPAWHRERVARLIGLSRLSMTDPLDMTGKVVIVTGGGRGVGRGIAERFLEAGAEVVICGRKPPESLPEHAGRLAHFVAADVRELEQTLAVIVFATQRFGRLDVLVNNAGGSPAAPAATASPRFSEAILKLNLIAPLQFAQQANAIMQNQPEGGSIVNIASVSALRPSPGTAAYGAAKAGLLSLTQTLAVEWAPKVRVNAVTAGMIETELAHLFYGEGEARARVAATVPLGRLGTPRDVADACLFLASPLAAYVTGASLLVHGGGEKPAFLDAVK